MHENNTYLHVALPVPIRSVFDYQAPNPNPDSIIPGSRVKVSFGNRELIGIVVSISTDTDTEKQKIKTIKSALDPEGNLPEELLSLCQWLSSYYMHPIGEVLFAATPPYLRSENVLPKAQHWVHTTEGKGLNSDALKRSPKQQAIHQHLLAQGSFCKTEAKHLCFSNSAIKALSEKELIQKIDKPSPQSSAPSTTIQILNEAHKTLNAEQSNAIDAISFHNFSSSLLHGITGSGKTEVYLQLAARALQAGKQALILIPEIGLSPQTVTRFRQRFAANIVELHSGISDLQRTQNWLQAKIGQAQIVIGTRLAALSAFNDLGLIIVDEEHDSAYKQQDSIRYSARDLSIYRAKSLNIPIILGSATPSLETLRQALHGNYQHLVLRNRATAIAPPKLELLDMRQQAVTAGLSAQAVHELKTTLSAGKQVLIFLNRRGFAAAQMCHACGWISECHRCSATMTLHSRPSRLHCHHCDHKHSAHKYCPNCGNNELIGRGLGTEQIEQALNHIAGEFPVIRIDRDSTRSKKALNEALKQINEGSAGILVGTQMLAKGHHFANLELVIVVDSDQGLVHADYRAMEKMGQLLMQVAGRAGREHKQGKVLLQTHRPDHPLLQLLISRGYTQFAKQILYERETHRLPPYWYSAILRAESKRAENAIGLLQLAKQAIQAHFPPSSNYTLIGPVPCNIEKIQDRYRYQITINSVERKILRQLVASALQGMETSALSKRVRWGLDIDPIES